MNLFLKDFNERINVVERFRLVHLKSEGSEREIFDREQHISKKDGKDMNIDSHPREYQFSEFSSSEVVLKQAKTDLKHPDPRIRAMAVKYYLEKSNLSVTMPLLHEILSDSDPSVRIQALCSLIKFKNPVISPLLKRHLKDNDPMVRITALRGMFQLGEKIDLNILLQLLSDESPWVRRKIAVLLGWSPIEGVLPILIEMSKDKDVKVRKAALFSLINLYPEEGEERLIEATIDPSPEIRQWARERLDRIFLRPISKR